MAANILAFSSNSRTHRKSTLLCRKLRKVLSLSNRTAANFDVFIEALLDQMEASLKPGYSARWNANYFFNLMAIDGKLVGHIFERMNGKSIIKFTSRMSGKEA